MAQITSCLHASCRHNVNHQCTAAKVEIDEYLHCSSWEVK